MDAIGVDGDHSLQEINEKRNSQIIIEHDYTKGKLDGIYKDYDLAWSVEFLEHVKEEFVPNIFDTFLRCKYVVITHGLPHETWGHHHVNLQEEDYWVDKFERNGFEFNKSVTMKLRENSTMAKNFIRNTGKFFERVNEN